MEPVLEEFAQLGTRGQRVGPRRSASRSGEDIRTHTVQVQACLLPERRRSKDPDDGHFVGGWGLLGEPACRLRRRGARF